MSKLGQRVVLNPCCTKSLIGRNNSSLDFNDTETQPILSSLEGIHFYISLFHILDMKLQTAKILLQKNKILYIYIYAYSPKGL